MKKKAIIAAASLAVLVLAFGLFGESLISQTKKETKERRKQMSIKVFEVKIQIDKLSKEKSEKIKNG